jgi:hypothetical protein
MMADVALATREITVPDEPGAWERLGFAVGEDGTFALGGVRIRTGADAFELGIEGLAAERPDGLAIVPAVGGDPGAATHPNGASVVDHVVAFTDDRARTVAALEAAGLDLRRTRDTPAPMAFLRAGSLILEVVASGARGLWGFVVVVPDVDGLGELVGTPRDAVQPGRRIVTVRREAGLGVALAFMTPRPG